MSGNDDGQAGSGGLTADPVAVVQPDKLEAPPLATDSLSQARTGVSRKRAYWNSIPEDKPLTRLQRSFVAEYLKDQHGANAVRRLGRVNGKPDHRAWEWLQHPNVRKAVEDGVKAREDESAVTVESLRKRYSRFAFAEHEGPILASHVLTALDRLGNHLGMFKPETSVIVPVQFNIQGGPPLNIDNGNSPQTITQSPQERPTLTAANLLTVDKPEPKGR